jgi:hypothetical protein
VLIFGFQGRALVDCSPWTSVGQKMMAGPIADEGVSISTMADSTA